MTVPPIPPPLQDQRRPRDQPPERPRGADRAGLVFAVVQTVSACGLLAGLWLVLGWELAVLIASAVTFTGSIVLETASRRRPMNPRGDR